jgi:UDP-N-acetylmuramoylalanine--D-glutamate ligase
MLDFANKQILVAGLAPWRAAVCELLRGDGADVVAIDSAEGDSHPPEGDFVMAVIDSKIPMSATIVQELQKRSIPVAGELELCFLRSRCLSVAIGGTNGKSTTAEMIERMLNHNHRKTLSCGPGNWPINSVGDQTKELDLILLQAPANQLERTQSLRPSVAVLLNLSHADADRYPEYQDYIRANARLFANQEPFDWAIVQTEALARLKELNLTPPSKVITFSATDPQSDLYLDRGLIISRLENWSGPLLDTDQCLLCGPHNAENLMAALAVGHALRLPHESMVEILKSQKHGEHRFELVAEIDGVQYIDDAKAGNVDALRCALLAARPGKEGAANIWLISGGDDEGRDFHAVSPLISKRVKGAFLIGGAREKIRSAWSLFTPCTLSNSLLEAMTVAAKNAASGDVVLLSPACSSFDEFQNYQQCGQKFYILTKSISRGGPQGDPN